MLDLAVIIPLYGKNCEDVSLRMISSLAIQKTKYNVEYEFYYDDTVSKSTLNQIRYLLDYRDINYNIFHCEKSASGYKRNLALEYAKENAKYVWFIDQDDYLISDYTFEYILNGLTSISGVTCLKINFAVPDKTVIGEFNYNTIIKTPTMPWLYVIRTDKLDGLYFMENMEYGSDIPYTINFLVSNGYYAFDEDGITLHQIKPFVTLNPNLPLYYYNYLNINSYMNKHAKTNGKQKEIEIEKASALLQECKDKHKEKESGT